MADTEALIAVHLNCSIGDVSSTWIQWNADVAIIANDLRITPAIFTEASLKPNRKRFEVAALLTAVPKGYPVFPARWT